MAKDKLGNALKPGDLVQVTLPSVNLFGRITKITPGGRVMGIGGQKHGKQQGVQFQPEAVKVLFDFDVLYLDPNNDMADTLVKVEDPEVAEREKSDKKLLV